MLRKVLVSERTWPNGYSKPAVTKEIGIGNFHCWGSAFEEYEAGPGNYTIAIVEMPNGEILKVDPVDVKFIQHHYDLYLLSREDGVGYDEYRAKLVAAESELEARKIANIIIADEGRIWEDHTKVKCKKVILSKPCVILSDFKNG